MSYRNHGSSSRLEADPPGQGAESGGTAVPRQQGSLKVRPSASCKDNGGTALRASSDPSELLDPNCSICSEVLQVLFELVIFQFFLSDLLSPSSHLAALTFLQGTNASLHLVNMCEESRPHLSFAGVGM